MISGDLARLAWRVAWQREQYDDALNISRSVSKESDDFRDKIANGNVIFARYQMLTPEQRQTEANQKLLKEAGDLYRGAVEKAPEQPAAWFAYMVYLVQSGQREQAEQALAAAQQKLPEKLKQLRNVTIGRLHETLGQNEEAEQQYIQAITAAPDDVPVRLGIADFYIRHNEFAKAQEHLQKLMDPEMKAPETAVAWARTRDALRAAALGDYTAGDQALEALKSESGKGSHGVRVDNLQAQAAILARRGSHRDRQALIGVYEQLDKLKALTAEERFRLAGLYAQTDKWPQARETMEHLLSDDAANAGYLSWYANATLRYDSPEKPGSRAVDLVDKLAKVEPDSLRTTESRARLKAAQGDKAGAAEIVRAYVLGQKALADDAAPALVRQRQLILAAAADLCESWQEYGAAEELYRHYVGSSKEPEAALALPAFFARRGDFDQTLTLLEQTQSTCKPEAVGIAAASAMAVGQPTADQLGRADALIQTGLKEKENSIPLQTALAGLRTIQGRHAEAEELYRKLLAESPRNVAVQNNLAFLLAMDEKSMSEAKDLIDQAIAMAGPRSQLLDTRAVVRLGLADTAGAIKDLNDALADEPTSFVFAFHLAQAISQSKDITNARQTLLRAVDLGLRISKVHALERGNLQSLATKLSVNVPE